MLSRKVEVLVAEYRVVARAVSQLGLAHLHNSFLSSSRSCRRAVMPSGRRRHAVMGSWHNPFQVEPTSIGKAISDPDRCLCAISTPQLYGITAQKGNAMKPIEFAD